MLCLKFSREMVCGKLLPSVRGAIGKSATRWAGQIDDIDRFDCEFFGISPREASLMDPQQRMLLEVCWEAMEDAGEIPEALAGAKGWCVCGRVCTRLHV